MAEAMAMGEGQTLDEIMCDSEAIAAAVIKRLEQADILATPSPSAMRRKVYDTLVHLGIDVPRLVRDTRKRTLTRNRARIRHQTMLTGMVERDLASGKLNRSEAIEARMKLASAPKKIASYRAIIDKVISRPKYFSTAPTPERRAKDLPPKVVRTMPHAGASSPKSHQFESAIQQAHFLSAQENDAVNRIREAWENRTARPSIGKTAYGLTAGYTRPSDRLGLSEKQQDAARLWSFMEKRLGQAVMHLVRDIVLEDRDANQAADWGRRYVRTSDQRRARGAYEGALKTLAAVLRLWVDAYDIWQADERERRKQEALQRAMNDRR